MSDRALTHGQLAEFAELIRETGCTVVDELAAGLSADEISSNLQRLNLHPPTELMVWFSWQNGITGERSTNGVQRSIGAFQLVPLGELTSHCEQMRKIYAETNVGLPSPWEPSWFPLVMTDTSADIVADCMSEPLTRVRGVDPETGDEANDPRSLGELVEWWSDAIRDGVWEFDRESGYWDWHRDLCLELYPSRARSGVVM